MQLGPEVAAFLKKHGLLEKFQVDTKLIGQWSKGKIDLYDVRSRSVNPRSGSFESQPRKDGLSMSDCGTEEGSPPRTPYEMPNISLKICIDQKK